jgi:hypothetical protein
MTLYVTRWFDLTLRLPQNYVELDEDDDVDMNGDDEDEDDDYEDDA